MTISPRSMNGPIIMSHGTSTSAADILKKHADFRAGKCSADEASAYFQAMTAQAEAMEVEDNRRAQARLAEIRAKADSERAASDALLKAARKNYEREMAKQDALRVAHDLPVPPRVSGGLKADSISE